MSSSATAVKTSRILKWRRAKDNIASGVISVGGLSVIGAILLIMFYLFYVVAPMFWPASVELKTSYATPSASVSGGYIALDEQVEKAARFAENGQVTFFDATNGDALQSVAVAGGDVSAMAVVDEVTAIVAYGFNDGTARLVKAAYKPKYTDVEVTADNPNGLLREIIAELKHPLGEDVAIDVSPGSSVDKLSLVFQEDVLASAAWNAQQNKAVVTTFTLEESMFEDGYEAEEDEQFSTVLNIQPEHFLIDPLAEWLFVANQQGQLDIYNIKNELAFSETIQLLPNGEKLTDLQFLRGGISLLAASDSGIVSQWFMVRDENNRYNLKPIREFDVGHGSAVSKLVVEHRRKGFAGITDKGELSIHYSSSARELSFDKLVDGAVVNASFSPRANAVVIETADGKTSIVDVENEHPEVSMRSLWGEIWYESYQEEDYIWQSSAANDDFEPKFSLTPLAFGTMKAAFYAMLMALPLAIAGAVYTAYFMSPGLRQLVKPVIEIMEALPTVILGFLAGLWLAPMMEAKMIGIFLLLIFIPLSVILFGYAWDKTPEKVRLILPEGWQPLILVPVIALATAIAFGLSDPIEAAFFAGNAPQYLTNELGIDYDQRNSLVVGFAMGFAVIPTIFSITEDAVFGVPKALSNGSLALGATKWQTLVRVVIPTASPGMFSAVMIGMGRAVGETMIVLMATGNTPIMDFNIFEGMRTLSANIAVEMPESEVGSSHYRILFLAGLVLFIFTFMFNTVAELVRQRLREKYSTI